MIPYEELERALARWKARRSGTVETTEAAPMTESAEMAQADATPSGLSVVSVAAASATYQAPDHTGELDLTDADVSDA